MSKRDEEKKEKQKYFEEALSDFVHDAASGGAIRHLAQLGYTTGQIMERLDFPTPRERVEKTVSRYLMEQGILVEKLPCPEEEMTARVLKRTTQAKLCATLRAYIQKNGEAHSFAGCPFGVMQRKDKAQYQRLLSCLTLREREYMEGLPLADRMMYHRLNDRMLEISIVLAVRGGWDARFYFLDSREMLCMESGDSEGER